MSMVKTCILIVCNPVLIAFKDAEDGLSPLTFQRDYFNKSCICSSVDQRTVLAHLSRRLISELIVYQWYGVHRRRPSSIGVRPHFQTSSSQNYFGRSKPNFIWSLLENESLFAASGSTDQDDRHAHIW